jgi:hypothetical protein
MRVLMRASRPASTQGDVAPGAGCRVMVSELAAAASSAKKFSTAARAAATFFLRLLISRFVTARASIWSSLSRVLQDSQDAAGRPEKASPRRFVSRQSQVKTCPMRRIVRIALVVGLALLSPTAASAIDEQPGAGRADLARYRGWIAAMKASPRGPFSRLRWFCTDGAILPPTGMGCAGHGTGVQHGEWSPETKTLRSAGYEIATVLASLEPERFVGPDAEMDALGQILVERFLVDADQGWILRGALSYRGAFQVEDEEKGARDLIERMLADPAWHTPEKFLLLRETVRLLPLEHDAVTASTVRRMATDIAKADKSFEPIRAKIHGRPDAGDAQKVRDYAAEKGKPATAAQYQDLAGLIDELYAPRGAAESLERLAASTTDLELAAEVRTWSDEIMSGAQGAERLGLASRRLAVLRDRIQREADPSRGLTLLLASLAVEREAYAAANTLGLDVGTTTRRHQVEWLLRGATGGYGIGLLSKRQLSSIQASVFRIAAGRRTVTLGEYLEDLRFLGRGPAWGAASLEFVFGPAIARLSDLEPLARTYAQDRLRGSPMLVYGVAIDSLTRDANAIAEIQQELFGVPAGSALRALNPGLVRGVLREVSEEGEGSFDSRGIYLLPETIADLPPVAGILTRGEGSSLSHVQLLANNLGIPNVVVGEPAIPAVRSRLGRSVVLAVTPNGIVRLVDDGPWWDVVFDVEGKVRSDEEVVIRPDLAKLDLSRVDFLPLSQVRAADSGKLCGPKGANLGELRFLFRERIPNGFVIPFGAFRAFVDLPIEPGGPSVFEWMKGEYAAIAEFPPGSVDRQHRVRAFLTRLRQWITTTDPGPEFRAQLQAAIDQTMSSDASAGVFVRSDTNVEDLPGFTGAGLNLTVPNVVGFERILAAVQEVWASPFTERAYSWRQAHMEQPAYVFPAVVVQRSFPSEKSGVMVTTDLESRKPGWISVAVSEGVGGVVDGQAAEALRVNLASGEVRQLSMASAPYRRVLTDDGGLRTVRATGTDTILRENEVMQLIALARDVGARFPGLVRADGTRTPADVEFAFRDGHLAVLQIRPFVDSKRARGDYYLAGLDAGLRERVGLPVVLDAVPGVAQ